MPLHADPDYNLPTELAIFLINLEFAKELLDEAELDWAEHNRVVETLFGKADAFFEGDYERLRHNWNKIGFYWYLSELREKMSAHLFSQAELEFSKEAANQWEQLFEPLDQPQRVW